MDHYLKLNGNRDVAVIFDHELESKSEEMV